MKYPQQLITMVNNRSQGFHLEGLVNGQGNPNANLMLIGEAPGRTEIESNIPFSGRAGKELITALHGIGLEREDVYITSTVRSRPYAIKRNREHSTIKYPNRKPLKKEILAHAPLLDWEIQHVNPQIIITLGSTALQRILGSKFTISDSHGKVINHAILQLDSSSNTYKWTENMYTIIPLYHPAAIFYNRKLTSVIDSDWKVVEKCLNKYCI